MTQEHITVCEVELKIRGFKSRIPKNIDRILFVRSSRRKLFMLPIQDRQWIIREDVIYLTGSYSKFKIIRWFQKIKELIAPERVILKYTEL